MIDLIIVAAIWLILWLLKLEVICLCALDAWGRARSHPKWH